MKKILLGVVFAISILMIAQQYAEAIGPYPCYYGLERFDKLEYQPGETITIRSSHCEPETKDQATLYIVDAKLDIFDSQVFADILAGKHSIYQETKNPINGRIEFNYKIPESDSRHQYMVLISPGGMGGAVTGYFFTKENASNVVLSDLKILNKPKQGENLKFELKALDGAGAPIPILDLRASTKFVDCQGNQRDLENNIPIYQSDQYQKEQYFSRGVMWGWLPIPQGMPGTYELVVSADTFSASSSENHWKPSEPKKVQFEVLFEPAYDNKIRLLVDNYYPEHISYPDFADIAMEDQWYATSQIITNSCSNQEVSFPLKFELLSADMDKQAASDKFGPNFLSYGEKYSCYKMPEICSIKSVGEMETQSKAGGYMNIPEEFLKPIRQKPGEYLLKATTVIDGTPIEKTVGIRTHHIKDYHINTDEGEAFVRVDSWYSESGTVSFDKQNKKITVNAETSDSPKRIDVYVNHYTLYGNYTVFVDGVQQNLDSNNVHEYPGQTLFTIWGANDKTTIEIIGTSAIPEFGPLSGLILTISLISVIVAFGRVRKNLNT